MTTKRRFLTNLGLIIGLAPISLAAKSVDYREEKNHLFMAKLPEKIVLYGDGIHDDTESLNAWFRGEDCYWESGEKITEKFGGKVFLVSDNAIMDFKNGIRLWTCETNRLRYSKEYINKIRKQYKVNHPSFDIYFGTV